MANLVVPIMAIISLVIGFGIKIFFGPKKGEMAQNIIEKVVKIETGIDLDPLFNLDNDEKKDDSQQ